MTKKTNTKKETGETKVAEAVTTEIAEKSDTVIFSKQEKQLYKMLLRRIDSELRKVEKSFLIIAFKLHRIYKERLYKIGDYQNIYDFAKNEYSLARGTCNNYINICERFGFTDLETGLCESLREEFKDYSASKLVIMVSMPDELIAQMNPQMTVREMKELRRVYTDEQAMVEKTEDEAAMLETLDTIQESLNIPAADDGLMDFEEGVNTVPLAEVEDIFSMPDELKEVISDAIKDFKAAHPSSKYRLSIALTW